MRPTLLFVQLEDGAYRVAREGVDGTEAYVQARTDARGLAMLYAVASQRGRRVRLTAMLRPIFDEQGNELPQKNARESVSQAMRRARLRIRNVLPSLADALEPPHVRAWTEHDPTTGQDEVYGALETTLTGARIETLPLSVTLASR